MNVPMTSPVAASLRHQIHPVPMTKSTDPTTNLAEQVEAPTMVQRIGQGAAEWTVERHGSFHSQPWGNPSQSDKALRLCLYENGLATAKLYRVKRRNRTAALEEAAAEMTNGYILGRGLLGTARSSPSYTKSDAEVEENANRLNDRVKVWSLDTIIHALDAGDHQLALYVGALWRNTRVTKLLGDRDGAAFLGLYCGGVGLAVAEEELFGPLT